MDDDARDEWLQGRQNGRVYPLGRALRDTYDADNADTLGSDVTGLMIDLSKVPYPPAPGSPAAPPPPASALPGASPPRPSILSRLGHLFARR